MNRLIIGVALICGLLSKASAGLAQNSSDDPYVSERKEAYQLYNSDRHLEALPLFEDLAKRNPDDADVLAGLASCLIDRSVTLSNQEDGAKERIRARSLLMKAQQLGNNSSLVQNLLQVTPENGVITYDSGAAGNEIHLGEVAFARRDFDEAIEHYSKALELDPRNYAAALFVGDTYFAEKKLPSAGLWYERAVQIDPNRETAYRYHSDMLTKTGDMAAARKKAIQAVVAEPYNPITWRGLQQWANASKVKLTTVHIKTPNSVSEKDKPHININIDPNQSQEGMSVWLVYSMSRAKWRGDEFKKHFPNEKEYRHSLPEEAQALSVAATVLRSNLGKKGNKTEMPKDSDLAWLLKISSAEMLEAYVLLSAADNGIAQDYDQYRQQNRAKLEAYLSEFIVPELGEK